MVALAALVQPGEGNVFPLVSLVKEVISWTTILRGPVDYLAIRDGILVPFLFRDSCTPSLPGGRVIEVPPHGGTPLGDSSPYCGIVI